MENELVHERLEDLREKTQQEVRKRPLLFVRVRLTHLCFSPQLHRATKKSQALFAQQVSAPGAALLSLAKDRIEQR